MKNLSLLLFFLSVNLFSQNFTCGVDDQEIFDHFHNIPASANYTNSTYDADTKYVFNVRFHVVYNDDGINRTNNLGDVGIPIGFDEIMNAIRDLNLNFNQFNIYFKYYGYDAINETDYLSLETYSELVELRTNYSVPDAINIFIVNGSVAGAPARTNFFDDDWFIRTWTQVHEMGHNFGLAHVFAATNGICEMASRNPNDGPLLFNAYSAGDMILDTHAMGGTNENNFVDCNYIGGALDCFGTAIEPTTLSNGYFISGPPYYNFLSAEGVGFSPCLPIFTPGQGVRMRENITGYWANTYNAQMNTIESLYEPFEYPIVLGNILSVEDQPENGGALVCRQVTYNLRFQKGFDYVFTNSAGNNINVGTNTQFNYIIMPNECMDVTINQVDPSIVHEVGCIVNKVDRLCVFEEYISGTIYSTAVLGSMNITIEELNEIEVRDPNLYENLMSEYYYILKKMTESGAIKESIFYKN